MLQVSVYRFNPETDSAPKMQARGDNPFDAEQIPSPGIQQICLAEGHWEQQDNGLDHHQCLLRNFLHFFDFLSGHKAL